MSVYTPIAREGAENQEVVDPKNGLKASTIKKYLKFKFHDTTHSTQSAISNTAEVIMFMEHKKVGQVNKVSNDFEWAVKRFST